MRNLLEKTDLSPIAHSANLQIEVVDYKGSPSSLVAKKMELEQKYWSQHSHKYGHQQSKQNEILLRYSWFTLISCIYFKHDG